MSSSRLTDAFSGTYGRVLRWGVLWSVALLAITCLGSTSANATARPHFAGFDRPVAEPVVKHSFDLRKACGTLYRPNQQFGKLQDGRTLVLLHEGNRKLCALAYDGTRNAPEKLWDYRTSYGTEPSEKYQPKFSVFDVDRDGQAEVLGMVSVEGGCNQLQVRDALSGEVEAATTPTRDGECAVPHQESTDDEQQTRNYVNVLDRGRIILNTERNSRGDTWEYRLEGGGLEEVWSTEGDGKEKINHHYPWRASFGGGPEQVLAMSSHLDGDPAQSFYRPDGTEAGPELEPYDASDDFRNHFDKCAFDGRFAYCSYEGRALVKFDATTRYLDVKSTDIPRGTDDAKIHAFGDFLPFNRGEELLIYHGDEDDETDFDGTTSLWDTETGTRIKDAPRYLDECIAMDYDGRRLNGEECLFPQDRDGPAIQIPKTGRVIPLQDVPGAPAQPEGQRNPAAPVDLIPNGLSEEISVYNGTTFAVFADPTARGWGTRWWSCCYRKAVASGEYDNHPEREYNCP